MAASRKLQGEIDRCLKKVAEGVETFEDIWQKVHNATNSNQKEKYEADLKKEIKKLQRLRDQIKSWIASAEIKDKSTLMDNRKLIETQMERFKVVERETKTKAYSKEGLGAAQKLDPAQKEREEIQNWLISSIDQLNIQTDSFESEIESLLANKKKKLDKEKQERMDDYKGRLERHRFHIRKLETLLRMLDNMSVEVQQIRRIKDNVEYYIESSQEPDFEDNEFIYDDIIGLDDVELSGVGLPSSATTDSNETGGTPTSIISGSTPISSPLPSHHHHQQPISQQLNNSTSNSANANYNHSSDSSGDAEKRAASKDQPKPIKPTPVRATTAATTTSSAPTVTSSATMNNNSINNSTLLNSSCGSSSSTLNYSSTSTTSGGKPTLVSSTPSKPSASSGALAMAVTANSIGGRDGSPSSQMISGNFAAVAANASTSKTNASSGEANPTSVITNISQVQVQNTTNAINSSFHMNNSSLNQSQSSNVSSTAHKSFNESHVQNNCSSPEITGGALSSIESQELPTLTNGATDDKLPDGMTSLKSMAQQVIDRTNLENNQVILESNKPPSQTTSDAHIPPLLGVAPLGAIPLQKEHQQQFQLMEAAYYHMPVPQDSERLRPYLSRSPYNTPSYYIQTPLPHSDSLEFYQRLATETLFFVFYYMEGTKAQYLAAKALKKQSWRFHTKYMMWFQRHEEPKVINEEYEQGTYIYFDYEKWSQRKKEGFTFEYKFLEDRDLN